MEMNHLKGLLKELTPAHYHTHTHTHFKHTHILAMRQSLHFQITHSKAAQPADICFSPSSCRATPIWSRWSPEWGWASCGSRPSPGRPAKQPETHIQALLFIFTRQRVPEEYFFLVSIFFSLYLCLSRHLPSVTKRQSYEIVSVHCLNHLFAPSVFLLYVYAARERKNTFRLVENRLSIRKTQLFSADFYNTSAFLSFRTGPTSVCESVKRLLEWHLLWFLNAKRCKCYKHPLRLTPGLAVSWRNWNSEEQGRNWALPWRGWPSLGSSGPWGQSEPRRRSRWAFRRLLGWR